MEERITCKSYVVSDKFNQSRQNIYEYTLDIFGYFQAERYLQKIKQSVDTLPCFYMLYPECRHIPTPTHIYRNIILDAHLIIYRITEKRIEVLDIVHSASSIGKIRNTRKVHV